MTSKIRQIDKLFDGHRTDGVFIRDAEFAYIEMRLLALELLELIYEHQGDK